MVFFLKNRLHLTANATAQFNLWVSIPLYLSFGFGLLRDRWNPFGAGDKGHLILFGLLSAVLFGAIAFLEPTYAVLMVGLLLVTSTVLVALSAANGIFTAMGQEHLMPGQSSAVILISTWIPVIAGYLLGGVLSQTLEGLNGGAAARALFLVAAGLMIGAAVLGGLPGSASGSAVEAAAVEHAAGHPPDAAAAAGPYGDRRTDRGGPAEPDGRPGVGGLCGPCDPVLSEGPAGYDDDPDVQHGLFRRAQVRGPWAPTSTTTTAGS